MAYRTFKNDTGGWNGVELAALQNTVLSQIYCHR